MKLFVSACLAGSALISSAAIAQTAPAPAAAAPAMPVKQFMPGLAIVSVADVVNASNAYKNAASERQIVYKNQIAMAEARTKQINLDIQQRVAKYNADRQAPGASQADLQAQAQALQNFQQSGTQEVQNLLAPVALSEAFTREQISDVINKAITNAMDRRGVSFVVPPQNVLAYDNGYNLSPQVLAELNALLPVAKVIPSAGWRPRAEREAAAAQAAQLAQPARPAPAGPSAPAKPRGQ